MKAVDDTLLLQYGKTHSRHEIHERIYIENITDMIMMAQEHNMKLEAGKSKGDAFSRTTLRTRKTSEGQN